MVKNFFYFILFITSFPCYGEYVVAIDLKNATSDEDIAKNQSFWQSELGQLKDKTTNYYFTKLDLASIGNEDYITFMENKEICGMKNCPMKVISNGKEILSIYAPLKQYPIIMEKQSRAFYPDFIINNKIFSYRYDTNQYHNKTKLVEHPEKILTVNCLGCDKKNIPTNPLNEKLFNDFAQELKYEAETFNDPSVIGVYGMSRLAFIRIGLVEESSLLDTSKEFKWTKFANSLGIKNNADFIENEKIQDSIFNKYILYLHSILLKSEAINFVCIEITDIYGRTANIDYWGLLKGAYMMGSSINHSNTKDYDGTDENKHIIDGIALSNNCIKKIITGFIMNKNMLLFPKNSFTPTKRGTIE